MRVVELNWKKGIKTEMHSHPIYLTCAITPLKYKSTSLDGKTQTRSLKKGEISWHDSESHAFESLGRTGRALIIELR